MLTQSRFASKLAGQHVLLIGATGGIGIALAQGLLEFGASVFLSSSSESKVQQTINSLITDYPSAKGRVFGYACDLSGPDVEANLENLFSKVGQVNHIVYLAGERLPTEPLAELTLEKMQKTFHIRTFAGMLTAKVGAKYLTKEHSSSITFTTGSICEKPIPGGWAMLASIGAGITGTTRQLAYDMAPIRVNAVAPGIVATDFWSSMGNERAKAFLKQHAESMPTKKVAQPEDVAEAFLYLLRDNNTTGQVVHTNSGAFLI